jgi:hypothetical protein
VGGPCSVIERTQSIPHACVGVLLRPPEYPNSLSPAGELPPPHSYCSPDKRAARSACSLSRCTWLRRLVMGDSSTNAMPHAAARVVKYAPQPYSFTIMDRGMPAERQDCRCYYSFHSVNNSCSSCCMYALRSLGREQCCLDANSCATQYLVRAHCRKGNGPHFSPHRHQQARSACARKAYLPCNIRYQCTMLGAECCCVGTYPPTHTITQTHPVTSARSFTCMHMPTHLITRTCVGGAQVCNPAQKALAGAHAVRANQLRAAQPDQHLRPVPAVTPAAAKRPSTRGLTALRDTAFAPRAVQHGALHSLPFSTTCCTWLMPYT